LHRSAARGLGLDPVALSRAGGLGDGDAISGTVSHARSMRFGDLEFRDCLVEISDREIAPGADGVLAAGIFEAFRIRIDANARVLDLDPLPAGPAPVVAGARAAGLNRLLLLPVSVDGADRRWFLLDTGAAYTTVDASLTPLAHARPAFEVSGAQG